MKKKKNIQLKMDLASSFKIAVASDAADALAIEISNGSACLAISIYYGGGFEYGTSLYIDNFSAGGFKIDRHENGFSTISVSGEVFRNLDLKFDEKIISELEKAGNLEIKCGELSDSNGNYFYIDGDEGKAAVIGKCSLLS